MRDKKGRFVRGAVSERKGKKHTKETILKMSFAQKGKKYSQEYKNKMSQILKGRKHSSKWVRKQAKAQKGEKSHQWRGGITPMNKLIRESLEYKLWREAVYKRDNFTCIWCGDNKGGNLEADHIRPFALYPELRFAIDNGRTLCHKCHLTTGTYGNKNIYQKRKGGEL